MTAFTETEKEMVNVERVSQYVGLPSESDSAAAIATSAAVATAAISTAEDLSLQVESMHGSVTFDNVVMSYRPGLAPSLTGLSFRIREGERIGVVGRTGAGKSSILQVRSKLALS